MLLSADLAELLLSHVREATRHLFREQRGPRGCNLQFPFVFGDGGVITSSTHRLRRDPTSGTSTPLNDSREGARTGRERPPSQPEGSQRAALEVRRAARVRADQAAHARSRGEWVTRNKGVPGQGDNKRRICMICTSMVYVNMAFGLAVVFEDCLDPATKKPHWGAAAR